ncbi:right-handed parallel beta-helix repeat-containing protein [Streptomyces sp. NPDC021562]|uniref:right-handed parallel beta-helix repeat-containing protein n=1 Tax=Streptomyces sp. NPDC021562 TaxID=3155121 RepID=UPI0033F6723A
MPVFERRVLPGASGDVVDSFRRTDTIDFARTNRRTQWVRWDDTGTPVGTGSRHYDTAGTGWRDTDGRGRTVREYRDGLQKFNGRTGHTLGVDDGDGAWTWHRYDGDGTVIASGPRTRERMSSGWTDRTADGRIAQRQWGMAESPERAGQYQEHAMDPADGSLRATWERHSPHGKEVGRREPLADGFLTTDRWREQRPPPWVRTRWLAGADHTRPPYAHVRGDDTYQLFTWTKEAGDGTTTSGVRYVGMDGSAQETARLSASGCSVADAGANGLLVTGSGEALLADCRIDRSAFSAVHLAGTAVGRLADCRVRGGSEHGVHATGEARVELTDCGITDVAMTGVSVLERAVATLSGCRVAGAAAGIGIGSAAKSTVADSTVTGTNEIGVQIAKGAAASLTGIRIRPPSPRRPRRPRDRPRPRGLRRPAGQERRVPGGGRGRHVHRARRDPRRVSRPARRQGCRPGLPALPRPGLRAGAGHRRRRQAGPGGLHGRRHAAGLRRPGRGPGRPVRRGAPRPARPARTRRSRRRRTWRTCSANSTNWSAWTASSRTSAPWSS